MGWRTDSADGDPSRKRSKQRECGGPSRGPSNSPSSLPSSSPNSTPVPCSKVDQKLIVTLRTELKDKDSTIESLIAELSLKDDTTDTPNNDPSPAGTSPAGTCQVDSYEVLPGTTESRCARCDGHSGNYGTSTCGIVGATHEDQCKYSIRMCIFDLVKNRMVFAEDIPEIKKVQVNDCYAQALRKGGCGGMFYDTQEKASMHAIRRDATGQNRKKARVVRNDFVFQYSDCTLYVIYYLSSSFYSSPLSVGSTRWFC